MKIWIGNIEPGTSDEELRALLAKYGSEVEVASIEQVPGDGTRPGAILDVAATPDSLYQLAQRLNGLYWKGRSLTVQAMTR